MLSRPRLLWQLFLPLLAIVAGALLVVSVFGVRSLRDLYIDTTGANLAAQSHLAARLLRSDALRNPAVLDAEVKKLATITATRITIIRADGTVVADSNADPATMDNHAARPEVVDAARTGTGRSVRFSDTLREEMMYVAVPLRGDDASVVAFVRTAVPLTAIQVALRSANLRLLVAGVAILVLAGLTILLVSRRVSRPLEALERAAARYAEGEFDVRVPASGSGEMASVAGAINRMAAELDDRLRTVVRQRNEQEAVLASMVEGVIAIGDDGRVIAINESAGRLLDADSATAAGKMVGDVVRNPGLQDFIAMALASETPVEADVTLQGQRASFVQAHGAPIRDGSGRRIGSVVVLNDVTRLKRLEAVRSDFVANVSHELKTPITSIKGFLETLADGAVSDPQNAQRFVSIALRQADRLDAIIDDLLSLSRIEQDAAAGGLPRSEENVADVLREAIDVCRAKAEARQVAVVVRCDPQLAARVNAPLLEQALVNLIDNAVKYSEPGSRVEVNALAAGGTLTIEVRDSGSGIDRAHLPRLFERFYRVDKARSRTLGGTGLGLAIVKHIASAHGGSVTVESEPGKGSVFTLSVPRA